MLIVDLCPFDNFIEHGNVGENDVVLFNLIIQKVVAYGDVLCPCVIFWAFCQYKSGLIVASPVRS